MMKTIGLVCILLLCSSFFIFADGAGGILLGTQTAELPLPEGVIIRSNSMNIFYTGGFGYGIVESNQIIGGFGYSFGDSDYDDIAGGIGGVTLGHRIIGRPLFIALLLNLGAGGISINDEYNRNSGYFVLFSELLFEAGVPVMPWCMISGYVGYQVMGNVITGGFFDTFISYTPVIGIKISFGKFY
jgi:hypothetical protein